MMSRSRRLLACAAAAAAMLAGGIGSSLPTASAAPAPVPVPNFPDEVLAEYRTHYADVPVAVLDARLRLMPARKELLARFAKEHADTFGGSWYDFHTGRWNLYATTPAATADMAAQARAAGIVPAPRVVPYSLASLVKRATRIGAGHDSLSALSRLAGVDLPGNRVTLSVEKSRRTAHDPMVTYIDPPRSHRDRLQACDNRRYCAAPMRSGIVLWRNNNYQQPYCSLGFVAAATDGSKWALTAGHCFADPGTDTTKSWGHGNSTHTIGVPGLCWWLGSTTVNGCRPTNDSDFGRIHILNSYWLNGGFGWVYNPTDPANPVEVDAALTDRWSQLEYGEVACLNAWHVSQPGSYSDLGVPGLLPVYEHVSDDRCGTIKYLFSGNDHNMVVVEDVDACKGDSGGGWTYYPGNGVRMAAGLHNGTGSDEPDPDPAEPPPACNLGMYARFLPLDTVNSRLDSWSATEHIRVITR
jgi:hypothetical protein